MNTPTNIPKDGYYSAIVYQDTGGAIRRAVQVDQGKVFDSRGTQLLLEACSDFKEMERIHAVEIWPEAHAARLEHLEGEVLRLNRVIDSDSWIPSACFGLLAAHDVPIGSPELLAAKDRVEAEMQTLRTANAGLVERVRTLEDARTKSAANSLANMLTYEEAMAKMAALIEAGDELAAVVRRDYKGSFCDRWTKAKGQG
jgi:hypothetical protein